MLHVPAEAKCVRGESALARQACSEHRDNDV